MAAFTAGHEAGEQSRLVFTRGITLKPSQGGVLKLAAFLKREPVRVEAKAVVQSQEVVQIGSEFSLGER